MSPWIFGFEMCVGFGPVSPIHELAEEFDLMKPGKSLASSVGVLQVCLCHSICLRQADEEFR